MLVKGTPDGILSTIDDSLGAEFCIIFSKFTWQWFPSRLRLPGVPLTNMFNFHPNMDK